MGRACSARSLPASVDEFLPGRGAVEPLDGVQAPAQLAGDLPQSSPFGAQPVDQRVVPPGALGVLPGGARLPGDLRFRQGRALLLRGGRRRRLGQAERWAATHFSTALERQRQGDRRRSRERYPLRCGGDTAIDNVSSPRHRSCGVYSKDIENRAGDIGRASGTLARWRVRQPPGSKAGGRSA